MRARAYLPGCLPLQSAPFAALSHRSLGLSFPLPGHKSLMRKIMTPELFERYKNVKSSKGFSFSNAIQVPSS